MCNAKDKCISGGIPFLAFIGAAIYFVRQAHGSWEVIVALLKAAVWPVFLILKVFELLNI